MPPARSGETSLLTGSTSDIFRLAVPAMATQVSLTLTQLVDMVFLGRIGPAAIGGVGLVANLLFNIHAIGLGFSVGLTACMARMIGAGDDRSAAVFYRTGIVSIAALGVVLAPVLRATAREVLLAIGTPDMLMPDAVAYYRMIMVFVPFLFGMASLSAAFRAAGDARTPMLVGVLINLINVLLDWALIFGHLGFPAMGAAGAALASGVSFVVGSGLLLILSLSRPWGRGVPGRLVSPPHLKRIVRISLPATGERLTMSLSQMLTIAVAVNPLGGLHVAAFQIVLRLVSTSFMPGFGFAMASAALTGQLLGAGKPQEAERAVSRTVLYCMLVMTVFAVGFLFFPGPLVRLFTDDPVILEMARGPLLIYAGMIFFLAVATVVSGALQGAGDTRYLMILMLLTRFPIRVPLAWLLGVGLGGGLLGVWIGMSSDFLIRAVVLIFHFRKGAWKKIRV
jgi:putative MATE family efflux protein